MAMVPAWPVCFVEHATALRTALQTALATDIMTDLSIVCVNHTFAFTRSSRRKSSILIAP